ncbi:SAM-dependent methyltransferase [Nonomuraea sp. NPDC050556]|uniref:SAM-dependent methyltransferase n=1 Tax=Nonomuraea sp. NPDC050556 TaxID=3364369 RepID=UPI0037AEE5C4
MSLRFHEISEARHRILNPFTDAKLDLLGRLCHLTPGSRHLDLACGKGEMVSRWAADYGTEAVGVDISRVFLDAARQRAAELDVSDRVTFVEADAGSYQPSPEAFDLVSCIGATWIGGGTAGTLDLMRPALRPDGLALVGECYWITPPPPEALDALGITPDGAVSLWGTAERCDQAGFELVEMLLADPDDWDRYMAPQWWTLSQWLRDNPADPDVPAIRELLERSRRSHLEYGRQYLGWGVFVLRPTK